MAEEVHISDTELICFSDDETDARRASVIEAHLKNCPACRARWAKLQSGSQAYDQFHNEVLRPALKVPDNRWPQLRFPAAPGAKKLFARPMLWWAGAVAAASVVVALLYFQSAPQQLQMGPLLARASDTPAPPHHRIQLSVAGRSWSRPAVLASGSAPGGMEYVQALFVKANYNWDDPLSARSFAAWRRHLREKRDHVTSVAAADGRKQLYRLQTETPDGTLRIASLTLRSDDLAAIDGAFEFEDRQRVTMVDTGEDSVPPTNSMRAATGPKQQMLPPAGRQVSAADELRVLAALDEIGADVDEPLNVQTDATKQHVLVTGMGISASREQQIRDALAPVPNTIVRFSSAPAPQRSVPNSTPSDTYTGDANAPLRRLLEQRAGGASPLQTVTDAALDASNLLFARAHTLLVLAQKFPPDVEADFDETEQSMLRTLRHRHAVSIEETASELEEALKPLLDQPAVSANDSGETGDESKTSWQTGAEKLFEQVRALDQSLTKLLGGSYSNEEAQEVLNQLPKKIQQVRALAHGQAHAE